MPKKKTPYRSKVKIGVDAQGKDIVKYIQGYTRAELDQARQAVIARYITGEAPEADRLFGDYATQWYTIRKEPFASASSRESYRTALNKDLFPVFAERNLRAISAMELQAFLNAYQGRSATKITVLMATLRGIFSSAKADRLIATDPTASLVRPAAAQSAPKPALTDAQRQALVTVCAAHPQGHYLALLYYLGCRPGEARGLQWGDVDWKASLVHIVRDIDYKSGTQVGALKTEASRRDVPLPAPLAAILAPLRGLPSSYIAHAQSSPSRPLAKTVAERLWVELMQAAGLVEPATPNAYRGGDPRAHWRPLITPHVLRHNYITLCWESGFDAYETMQLVGHTSITTTMNIYTHLSGAQLEKTAAKLNTMFGKNKTVPRVAEKLH